MSDEKTLVFDSTRQMDPNMLLAMMNNNGGFGGNGNWIWVLFLFMMYGWGNNGNGFGFGGNNGTGFLANQLNNDAGRDLLLQAINGRADALNQIANMLNTSVESVKNGIFSLQSSIQSVGTQVGMSGLETINAIQAGNASIASKLAECCCENRLATCQQTNTLSSQIAGVDANVRLQLAQNEANDQLAVCQQTNALSTQADRNATSILNAIANQNTLITKEFCDLKERELQNKINTQGDIITQLRNQISNDKQTEMFNAAFNTLNDKVNFIASRQPNTVPVAYPNVVAVNATPNMGGCNGGCGCGNYGNGYWNN